MYPFSKHSHTKDYLPAYHSYGSSSSKRLTHVSRPSSRPAHMEGSPVQTSPRQAVDMCSKYASYPATKPFINTDFTRANKPVDAYPTSDRDAVISALRNLQDKVKKLEIERTAAEKNLRTLAEETSHVKEVMTSPPAMVTSPPASKSKHRADRPRSSQHREKHATENGEYPSTNKQTRELEGQLSSAEGRCQVLEQQLDYMRHLVSNSEADRRQLVEKTIREREARQIPTHTSTHPPAQNNVGEQFDRLRELERDQLRLTATQTLAENKIKELEEKVREEKLHRKTLQNRTEQLETASKEKNQLFKSEPSPFSAPSVIRTKKPPKKKKKKCVQSTRRPASATSRSEATGRHYRLNLANIPFVAGKSTSASHSLGANVQKVLAMMKSHNANLCSNNNTDAQRLQEGQRSTSPSSSSSSVASTDQELRDILSQLQDEFGQLTSEHQDMMHQMHSCRDSRLRESLEEDLDVLVSRMEAKSQQIEKVKLHQQKLDGSKKMRPNSGKVPERAKRPHSASAKLTNGHYNNYQHNCHNGVSRPKPASKSKPVDVSSKQALYLLRDMKKLQTTLRKDDLCWE